MVTYQAELEDTDKRLVAFRSDQGPSVQASELTEMAQAHRDGVNELDKFMESVTDAVILRDAQCSTEGTTPAYTLLELLALTSCLQNADSASSAPSVLVVCLYRNAINQRA